MKRFIFLIYYIIVPIVFILIGWFARLAWTLPRSSGNPIAEVRPTPLAKYTIENLSHVKIDSSQIQIGNVIKKYDKFTSYKFYFDFDPTFSDGPTKKVSGVINIPNGNGAFPTVVMFRGYVDPTQYFMGEGTQPAATVFASNGFVTIAPDFLGYGDSDKEAADVFESRFQTYTVAIETLKSVEALKGSPLKIGSNYINVDTKNIFIWAHSNGGQIALTTLETTGATYPTVLWAPVSKPFPYSILYYTDEADDGGRALRKYLADFEADYNTDLYSITPYLSQIKAPIQLNQGTSDAEVPVAWSNELDANLKAATVSATYIKYPGNDHNMRPDWNEVINNNLEFYKKHLK